MRISYWRSDVFSAVLRRRQADLEPRGRLLPCELAAIEKLDALGRRVEIRVARIERLDQDRAVLRPLQPHRVQSVALGGEADVVDTEALDGRFLDLPADANLAGFGRAFAEICERPRPVDRLAVDLEPPAHALEHRRDFRRDGAVGLGADVAQQIAVLDRKSTRLNSSH